jgi:hypothetical protein
MYYRVWRLACLEELDSHAGGSLAVGRVTFAGQVLKERPDRDILALQAWGLGSGPVPHSHKAYNN